MLKSVDIISLGCSKNLVDSERIAKLFKDVNYIVNHNPTTITSRIVIINTCGFIGDAKEESINMILNYANAKNDNLIDKLFVMGCLSERYMIDLQSEIPEVDGWYGKFNWADLVRKISHNSPNTDNFKKDISTPNHYAYIKISEGCNRHCAYCAIPLITGKYKSRAIEDILSEVKYLVKKGVKEFNIIAQDLTYYGYDLYGKPLIANLIDKVALIPGVEWIRLHYAYPTHFPLDLLDVIAKHNNICKYLDIALQHSSDIVLSKMRRHITQKETEELINKIRKTVPNIHIRTTLMVGFPGEGNNEFNDLVEFVKRQRFERMGAFAYCEEDDTFAAKNYTDNISLEIKNERLNQLMAIQENISLEISQSKIGNIYRVIIDSEDSDYYVARTEWDSPEVDPEVLVIKDQQLNIGNFYLVEIIDALPFELIAKVVTNDE